MNTDDYVSRAEEALENDEGEAAQVYATLAVVRAIQTAQNDLAFALDRLVERR